MFRRLARFVLWHHIKTTMWVSALIVVAALVYRLVAHSGAFDGVVLAIGILAAFVLVLSLLLYRRRKKDGSL